MSKIRSALELALEKTESVESNPERLREEEKTREGQRILSKYLFEKAYTIDEIQEILSSHSGVERQYLLNGMVAALISNISLPQNELYAQQLKDLQNLVAELLPEEDVSEHFSQLQQFYQQYLDQIQQLRSTLEQQYAPKLRQKQQQLAQQFGRSVELTPDQDPEFMELLNKHRQQIDEQYRNALDEFKERIKEMILEYYSAS